MHRTCLPLLILAVGFWSGCGRSTTVTGPEGERATVTEKGDGVEITIEGKEGGKLRITSDEGGVSLPDGFPKDVPLYPGATVATSATTQNMMNVSLQTTAQPEQVRTFYQGKLKEAGWETESTLNTSDGAMFQTTKEKRTLTVVIRSGDGKTEINLMVAEKGG